MKIRIERTYQVQQYEPLRVEVTDDVDPNLIEQTTIKLGQRLNQAILELRNNAYPPKTKPETPDEFDW